MSLLNQAQKIVKVDGHYEIHTYDGEFISSGSTWNKCYDDLKQMLVDEVKMLLCVSG